MHFFLEDIHSFNTLLTLVVMIALAPKEKRDSLLFNTYKCTHNCIFQLILTKYLIRLPGIDFEHLCLSKGFIRKYFNVYMVLVNELETKYEITRMIVFSYKTIFMLVSIPIYNIDLPVGTTPIRGYSRCSQNCLKHEWSTLVKTKRKSYE